MNNFPYEEIIESSFIFKSNLYSINTFKNDC